MTGFCFFVLESFFRFRYGNYNQYYGKRNEGFSEDTRMELFPKTWFQQKYVLDIGCNVGFLTILIAKKLQPKRVLGIDIDGQLVGMARKNIRHYCDKDTPVCF